MCFWDYKDIYNHTFLKFCMNLCRKDINERMTDHHINGDGSPQCNVVSTPLLAISAGIFLFNMSIYTGLWLVYWCTHKYKVYQCKTATELCISLLLLFLCRVDFIKLVFSALLQCSFLLQSKVWNTPQRSGEEIWRTAGSFDQFTTRI